MTIQDALNELENYTSVEQLATFLNKEQIKGMHHSNSKCPIAIFLKRRTRKNNVKVSTYSAYMYEITGYREYIPLPLIVRKFISDFDSGAFPELEMKY